MAGQTLAGTGRAVVPAPAEVVWATLLDPAALATLIPGAERVERLDEERFRAVLSMGVGPVRGQYDIALRLSGREETGALVLSGTSTGWLGSGHATARVTLVEDVPGRTIVAWDYAGMVFGPVAVTGGFLLRGASRLFVSRFFAALVRREFPLS